MPYVTQTELEYHLQKDFGNTPDAVVAYLIAKAEAIVEAYIGGKVEQETVTDEVHDGPGEAILWLAYRPVISITSVTELGVLLTAGTHYVNYENGRLVRMSGEYAETRWTSYRQAVKVTYEAGYATVPGDIKHAATDLAGRMFEQGAANAAVKTPGVNLERIGDYMAQYDIDRALDTVGLTDENKTLLNRHRKVAVA